MSDRTGPDRRIQLTSHNGAFSVSVDTMGARVSSIVHTATETEFLLRTLWGNEDWTGASSSKNTNEEWHRRYPGGWHTLLPHTGDARSIAGVEHPFHGEAAWRRWRLIEEDGVSCILEVVLRTVPFVVQRRVQATDSGIEVRQQVTNHSNGVIAFSWTEHPAFSDALIGPCSTVTIGGDAIEAVFPSDGAIHGQFQTVPAMGRNKVELRNDEKGTAAVLCWDPELFPYLYIWQEHRKTLGFPWWGRMNTIALEPASRPYDSDTGVLGPLTLAPNSTLTASFSMELTAR